MIRLSLPPVLVAGDDRNPAIILVSFRQHSGLTGWNLAAEVAASGRRLRELETGCAQRWFELLVSACLPTLSSLDSRDGQGFCNTLSSGLANIF
jgi:hypothetical protein